MYGLDNIPSGPLIIAANHTSYLDPPLIAASVPTPIAFLAQRKLFRFPLFGLLIKALNAYPIGGKQEEIAAFKLTLDLLKQGNQVLIFPEGSRSWDQFIQPFKSGVGVLAIRSKVAVLPVYIHGASEVWNRTRRYPQRRGQTACVFGKPINPHQFDHLPKKEAQTAFAEATRKAIEELRDWYLKHYNSKS